MDAILKNHNSTVNQEIKGKLVNREVYAIFTHEIEALLSVGMEVSGASCDLPQWDEIENYYSFPEFNGEYISFPGGSYEEKTELIEEYQEKVDSLSDIISEWNETEDSILLKNAENLYDLWEKLTDEITELEQLEDEPAEIFEWYAVTNWFAEKLRAQGQCILEYGCHSYWGRCTTGQAVLLDFVITMIAYDLEILDGQENSWVRN